MFISLSEKRSIIRQTKNTQFLLLLKYCLFVTALVLFTCKAVLVKIRLPSKKKISKIIMNLHNSLKMDCKKMVGSTVTPDPMITALIGSCHKSP